MFLLLLAYLGGVLTILSPCILPVLPFVFARSDQPFRKSGLPLLAGMSITFALVASLATVGGGWAVRANQFGRVAALALFAVVGLLHGYALGESIYGAEQTPLAAYLIGLCVVQGAIALTAMMLARAALMRTNPVHSLRLIGAGISGIGLTVLMQQLVPSV